MKLAHRPGPIGLIGLILLLAVLAKAEDTWVRVTTVRVKPDMIDHWRRLYKSEIIPAYKKAGVPSFAVWRTVPFGDAYEFTLMMPMKNFAEFDGDAPPNGMTSDARMQVKTGLDKCIIGAESMAVLALSDLAFEKTGAAPPHLVMVQTVTVAPKNLSTYLNFLKQDMKPAVEKAGVDFWQVYRHVFGSQTNQIATWRSLRNYADLDMGPLLLRTLGPEQANTLTVKDNQLVESSRIVIAQYDRELSYTKPR